MARWSGGQIAEGLVDAYPLPAISPRVSLTPAEVRRLLAIELSAPEIAGLLARLGFDCQVEGDTVTATPPPNRMDIGEGQTGKADLLEEIARIYGFNRIPLTRLDKVLPAQLGNPALEKEEQVRDALVRLGLQEVMTYRKTTPEREARLTQAGLVDPALPYIRIANPITPERSAMRRSLLSSVMEIAERNHRLVERLGLFEIGPVFWPRPDALLPDEPLRLAVVLTGLRQPPAWDLKQNPPLDFFDLKGIMESLLNELHIPGLRFQAADHPGYHPGKSALVLSGETEVGVFGELHPLVRRRFDLGQHPALAAELDLHTLLELIPPYYEVGAVPVFPAVLEDIAVVVDEALPNEKVEQTIRQGGGKLLTRVRLFDIFRGEQLGAGKKSLAYALAYQAADHTLTEAEAGQVRGRIIRRLEQELGAKLRS
jgi:phenylalanyl-tRNA synthetase beta chain